MPPTAHCNKSRDPVGVMGKADRHSLDFIFNRFRMKLFKTGSIDVVKDSQSCFAIDLSSCVLKRRHDKLIYYILVQ